MLEARVGPERYWFFPTLAWLSSSDTALQLMSAGGVIGSLLLIFDIAPILVLPVLWILYLSLVTVGQDFLAFQWDNLLLEAGFLAILLAPWHLWPRWLPQSPSAQGPAVAAVVPALSADVFLRSGQALERRSHLAQPDGAGPTTTTRSRCPRPSPGTFTLLRPGFSTARRRSCSSSNSPFPF